MWRGGMLMFVGLGFAELGTMVLWSWVFLAVLKRLGIGNLAIGPRIATIYSTAFYSGGFK